MSYHVETISVESAFGITIQNKLVVHDAPSNKLMVLLPGRGYTINAPLTYYLSKIGFQLGYDVLMVNYGFHLTQDKISLDQIPYAHADGVQAVEQVLARGYSEVCLAGKSMGTPIVGTLTQSLSVDKLSAILLTPVQSAEAMVKDTPTVAIIGTRDPYYAPDKIENTETLSWKVYDGLDHSLGYPDNWRDSVTVLRSVLDDCEHFLKAQS